MILSDERPYTFDRVVRMLLTGGLCAALFLLVRHLSDVLAPFVAAAVLAYLLNPVVRMVERWTRRRWAAVAITLGGLAVLFLLFLTLMVPLMASQWRRFEVSLGRLRADTTAASIAAEPPQSAAIPAAADEHPAATTQPVDKALGWSEFRAGWEEFRRDAKAMPRAQRLRRLLDRIRGTYAGDLAQFGLEYVHSDKFRELAQDALRRVFAGGITVINFAVEVIVGATVLIVVMIYLVFLLLDFPGYVRTWKSMLPGDYRGPLMGFLTEFEAAMRTYFRGQFIVACLTAVLFTIGFSIIGLPMAVPFGMFVGMLNMVPYLQTVALVPAFFLAVIHSIETSSFLGSFVAVLIVFGAVQVIMDGMLTPRIMGQATGLRPVSIMLGVFIWGKLLGFLGLLLAIPLTCLGIAYYRRLVLKRGEGAAQPIAGSG